MREFTLDTLRSMLRAVRKLGPLRTSTVPGVLELQYIMSADGIDAETAEADTRRLCGTIDAMTAQERRNPSLVIDGSRCRRVAAGAGVTVDEISQLVRQFEGMAVIIKRSGRWGRH